MSLTEPNRIARAARDYEHIAPSLDEMLSDEGRMRAQYRAFFESFEELPADAFERRWAQAERRLRENGVTYNVYGDPRASDRPWELDALPLLITPQDWQPVEVGLAQRARLLNAILVDLYGPQRVLKEKLLPPSLVFSHPGFLRPCCGITPPGGIFLHHHAADLAHAGTGDWWVLGDRTQAPSGAGYTLENRLVVRNAWPEAFRESQVRRLAAFYREYRNVLTNLTRSQSDSPRVVLLTPGPLNETYFEHSYLARYLGFTLVEGSDLTVRDARVFLKTLDGLQQVHAIVRRLDDDFCDPLELREDSSLGVPGLVQAASAGNVVIANALGTGLVESAAMLAFLPSLCRAILGEDLILPSIATWWCGQERECEYVIANLSDLVIKPAFPGAGFEPIFGGDLSAQQHADLVARIRTAPERFVGQERSQLSLAPVWTGDRLEPRRVLTRAYATVRADGNYAVLPGGLTRVASRSDSHVVSMQRGGMSKDTWVLSDQPVDDFSTLVASGPALALRRTGNDMPSRVADSLYWLGRYAERAEGGVRLLRSTLQRATGETSAATDSLMPALIASLDYFTDVLTAQHEEEQSLDSLVNSLLFSESQTQNLRAMFQSIRRAAASVRDRLSDDTWRIFNRLEDDLPAEFIGQNYSSSDTLNLLNRYVAMFAAFSGFAFENTTRGPGWRFLDVGRRVERALHTLRMLRVSLVRAEEAHLSALLDLLLETADSSMTYRARYVSALSVEPVLDLLVTDQTNPRSVAFQIYSLKETVDRLPRPAGLSTLAADQRLALTMSTRMRLADVLLLAEPSGDGVRHRLDEFIGEYEDDLPALSDALTHLYLAHSESMNPLAGLRSHGAL